MVACRIQLNWTHHSLALASSPEAPCLDPSFGPSATGSETCIYVVISHMQVFSHRAQAKRRVHDQSRSVRLMPSPQLNQRKAKMDAPGIEPGTFHKEASELELRMRSENHTTRSCTRLTRSLSFEKWRSEDGDPQRRHHLSIGGRVIYPPWGW